MKTAWAKGAEGDLVESNLDALLTIDQTFSFTVPTNVNLGQRAVATWRLESEGPPQGLAWNLAINGTQLIGFTHNTDRFTALQEVFQGSVLQAGSNNATVTVTGGNGRIKSLSANGVHAAC